MERWSKMKLLGAGASGKVFLASRVQSYSSLKPATMAVKSAGYGDPNNGVSLLKAEGKFLAALDVTPNIVQCFGEDTSVEDGGVVYNLLLEYAAGGSLQELIGALYCEFEHIPEALIARYASMLLRGLAEIHSRGIVHCDLKPDNVLVFPNRGRVSTLKIADFGHARWISEEEEVWVLDGGVICLNRGAPMYSSPESVSKGLHGTCTDIWSFGCIMVEMFTGEYIWNVDRRDLFYQIMHEDYETPPDLSEDGKDFLKRCLAKEPQERWSAKELLNHPFIVNNLKISPENSSVDLRREENTSQKSPFGVNGWVSKRQLFSKSVCVGGCTTIATSSSFSGAPGSSVFLTFV